MPWTLTSASGLEERHDPRGAIAADDISFLKRAVLAGGGVALLPTFLAAREEQAGKLIRVLPGHKHAGSALHVVYPSAHYVPQRVIVFREHLLRGLADVTSRCAESDAAASRAKAPRPA